MPPHRPTRKDVATPRNAPTRPLHLLPAARASALLAYATAHAGLCGTHNPITHCYLHRSVGARVPPPAFCPRAHARTLPRLRRRRGASRSPQSHYVAVWRFLRFTTPAPHCPPALARTTGCTHTHHIQLHRHCAHTGHPSICPVPCVLAAHPPLVARLHACCLQPLTPPAPPSQVVSSKGTPCRASSLRRR